VKMRREHGGSAGGAVVIAWAGAKVENEQACISGL